MAEFETEHRDAAVVKEALDLRGEPFTVSMVGRNVEFKYPIPETDD